jgi:hypothetical protein
LKNYLHEKKKNSKGNSLLKEQAQKKRFDRLERFVFISF